jgi:4-coumarate--CoA ligase
MSEIVSSEPAPYIPDNLTIPQFLFHADHALRAIRPGGVPFFIEDATGRAVNSGEVSHVVKLSFPTRTLPRLAGELMDWQMV